MPPGGLVGPVRALRRTNAGSWPSRGRVAATEPPATLIMGGVPTWFTNVSKPITGWLVFGSRNDGS